jgi:hypothetical protein
MQAGCCGRAEMQKGGRWTVLAVVGKEMSGCALRKTEVLGMVMEIS